MEEKLKDIAVRLLIENDELSNRIADLEKLEDAREESTRKKKKDAGYPDSVSLDVVWNDALKALKEKKAEKIRSGTHI